MHTLHAVRFFAISLALFAFGLPDGLAQTYPVRPVRMVVPFAPGGVDIIGRIIAVKMSERLGQQLVVENRGGANGTIGCEFVAHSPPDGYTLLFTTPSTHITAVFLSKNVPYDPVKDFTPISAAVEPVTTFVVHPDLPVKSISELVDYAKKYPGRLSYSSSGIGSVFHLTGELFKQVAEVDLVHVPYKGTQPALSDTVAGRIQITFAAFNSTQPQIRSGKVRLLAVLEASRWPGLPNIPTVGETLPGFEKPASWFGFFGPAALPRPIVSRVHAELVKALHSPDVKSKLDDGAYIALGDTPEEFAALIQKGFEVYARAAKAAGVKPE